MDERVKLVSRISGGHFFKVAATDVFDEGQEWLVNEIVGRGYAADELGPAQRKGRFVEIPIRRAIDE